MQMLDMIFQAGLVGCGGAGFPTHAKYNSKDIRTIIINAAECEPLLQNDKYVIRHYADSLVKAGDYLTRETGCQEFVIALKETYHREIRALQDAIRANGSSIRIHTMKSFFPAGDEQTMVYEVTGRVVPPAGIPIQVGCVVSNVATLYGIYEAMEGKPFTSKFLTVTGEVKEPIVARVPVGTPVKEVLALAGGPLLSNYIVVNGGPMMGKVMTREEAGAAYVTKTMSGLIVLSEDNAIARRRKASISHMMNRAKSACIQCRFCSDMCPRGLLGHPIRPHKIMRKLSVLGQTMGVDNDPEKLSQVMAPLLSDPDVVNAALCCECGLCEIVACPMGLQPRTINGLVKKELGKAGIRYKAPSKEWEAEQVRELRKAPTARVAARAGVGEFEEIQIDTFKELDASGVKQVSLELRQSIGVPSEPVVITGDYVSAGSLIAKCPDGKLGSNLHASISGRVTVGGSAITIQA